MRQVVKYQRGLIHKFSTQTLKEKFNQYYKRNEFLQGHCNFEKTQHLKNNTKNIHQDNWKRIQGTGSEQTPYVSSIGIGTMGGQPTSQDDVKMFQSLVTTLRSKGVNVIDTCCNFRYGKSQKVINAALNYLISEQNRCREEFFIATKCGFIPQDIDSNLTDKDIVRIVTEDKIAPCQSIVEQVHCIDPGFMNFSVQKSRLTLGLNTIDVVYLNNYPEAQLAIIGHDQYIRRLEKAFKAFEQMRIDGRIKYYGMCSFVCFRSPITEQKIHTSIQQIVEVAKIVGGDKHGFRFIMLPINLAMPQALFSWQEYKGHQVSVLELAQKENINIVSCTPLFQGRLATLPFSTDKMSYLSSNALQHIQLMRSLQYNSLVTTIVGQNTPEHVSENLKLLKHPKLTPEQWNSILPIQNSKQ